MVGGELNTAKVRLERVDTAGDLARLAAWRPQAHLGPQRSGKGPAAFMAGTARIRPKTIAAGRSRRNGFVSGRCRVVVAGRSTLGPGMQRRPRAMFVLLWSCRRGGQRHERAGKQDQQQQSGGQALHIQKRRRNFRAANLPLRFVAQPQAAVGVSSQIKHRAVPSLAQPPGRGMGGMARWQSGTGWASSRAEFASGFCSDSGAAGSTKSLQPQLRRQLPAW